MKAIKLMTCVLLSAIASTAFAKDNKDSVVIDGYTLSPCTVIPEYAENRHFCTKDKAYVKKVLAKAKTIKPNFDKNKKLIQLFDTEGTPNERVTYFFVVDDTAKKIYAKPQFAIFDNSYLDPMPENPPRVMSTLKHNTFCLYQKGAWFQESYEEGHLVASPVTSDDIDGRMVYVCSTFDTDYENYFSHFDHLFFTDFDTLSY